MRAAGSPSSLIILVTFIVMTFVAEPEVCAAEPPPTRSWIMPWNGPMNHQDEPIAMVMLADHSVILAGKTYDPSMGGAHPLMLRYDPAGNVQWTAIEPGFASYRTLQKSFTGDVLLTGFISVNAVWNVFVRRVNPASGETVWEARRPATLSFAPFNVSVAEDVATGTLLLAGALANDYLILRFALRDGAFIEQFTFDGPQHGSDRATAVAPYGEGGFVFAGTEGTSSGGYRVTAVNAQGGVIWTDHENGPIGNTFTPAWLGVDAQHNVLVGGGPETSCGLFQFRAWKISPSGQRLWTRDWPTANCASAEPADFAMGSDGSIAMVGQTHNPFNIALMHVDPNGTMWTRSWNGPANGNDDGVAITIDPVGNVIVAGETTAAGGSDIAALGFTRFGQDLFARIDAGAPNASDMVMDMSVPDADAFGIAAYAFTAAQNENMYTSLYVRHRTIGDVSGDGLVNVADLLAVVTAWGPCPSSTPSPTAGCTGDIAPDPTGDGQVNVGDLLLVISQWGA